MLIVLLYLQGVKLQGLIKDIDVWRWIGHYKHTQHKRQIRYTIDEIHESLLINKYKPNLNVQGNSIPLNLF